MDIAITIFIVCGIFILIAVFVSIYIMKRRNAEAFHNALHSLTRSFSRIHSRREVDAALQNPVTHDDSNGFCLHDFHGSPVHSSSPNTPQWPINVAANIAAPMVPSVLISVDGPPSYTSCNHVTPPPQYTAVFGPPPPPNGLQPAIQLSNEEVAQGHDATEGFIYPPVYMETDPT